MKIYSVGKPIMNEEQHILEKIYWILEPLGRNDFASEKVALDMSYTFAEISDYLKKQEIIK